MLEYKLVTKENLNAVFKIQKTIWPDFPDISHFIESISSKDNWFKYYIVTLDGQEIGLTGHYPENEERETIWLGWFGILSEYRSKGYGKQVLLDTIEMCKKSPYKYFRAYSTETYDASAQPLYQKIMNLCERYENWKDETYGNSTVVYSYSLRNQVIEPWDNKYIGIKEFDEKANLANELLKSK